VLDTELAPCWPPQYPAYHAWHKVRAMRLALLEVAAQEKTAPVPAGADSCHSRIASTLPPLPHREASCRVVRQSVFLMRSFPAQRDRRTDSRRGAPRPKVSQTSPIGVWNSCGRAGVSPPLKGLLKIPALQQPARDHVPWRNAWLDANRHQRGRGASGAAVVTLSHRLQ
jgi:hypothetical protein